MEKDLTVYQGNATPMTLDEAEKLGNHLVQSGYFKDVSDVSQAVVKILAGQSLGFDFHYSLAKLYIVNGRVTVMAEMVGAMIKRSNRYDYKVLMHNDLLCRLEFHDSGNPTYVSEFTIEQAQRAHLIKQGGAWESWPKAMLFSKALLQGARIVCPHIIAGVRTIEEYGQTSEGGQQFNQEQAEKDAGELWPEDVVEIGEVEEAVEEVEETTPPEATESTALQFTVEKIGFIDKVWFVDAVKKLQANTDAWGNGLIMQHLKTYYDVTGKTVAEAIAQLSESQAESYCLKIAKALDAIAVQ